MIFKIRDNVRVPQQYERPPSYVILGVDCLHFIYMHLIHAEVPSSYSRSGPRVSRGMAVSEMAAV